MPDAKPSAAEWDATLKAPYGNMTPPEPRVPSFSFLSWFGACINCLGAPIRCIDDPGGAHYQCFGCGQEWDAAPVRELKSAFLMGMF